MSFGARSELCRLVLLRHDEFSRIEQRAFQPPASGSELKWMDSQPGKVAAGTPICGAQRNIS